MSKDTMANFERWMHEMPRAEIGGLLKEYVAESNHGGWDGFRAEHLTGIRAFMEDLMLYYHNSRMDGGENLATKTNNTNPVP